MTMKWRQVSPRQRGATKKHDSITFIPNDCAYVYLSGSVLPSGSHPAQTETTLFADSNDDDVGLSVEALVNQAFAEVKASENSSVKRDPMPYRDPTSLMTIDVNVEQKYGIDPLMRLRTSNCWMKNQKQLHYVQGCTRSSGQGRRVDRMTDTLCNKANLYNLAEFPHRHPCKTFRYGSGRELSMSRHGCGMVDALYSTQTLQESFRKVRQHLIHPRYNREIQERIKTTAISFQEWWCIKTELEKDLVGYSANKYSCHVVQAWLDQYNLRVDSLLAKYNHLWLSGHEFGNYVIQHIIRKDQWYSNQVSINAFRNRVITDVFERKFMDLSRNKFGSHLVEMCIEVATNKQLEVLVGMLIHHAGLLDWWEHPIGRYVAKTLCRKCNETQETRLNRAITNLRSLRAQGARRLVGLF